MLELGKLLLLLCFIFINVIVAASLTNTTDTSAGINRFLQVIKSIDISNLAASAILLNPSNYLKYQAGLKNEDLYLDATQLIKKYGFPVETHHVTTRDNYILTLFRIPCGGPPALLVHGLLLSADDFLIAGPSSAMAYKLAADGYDVWLANVRGTKYSRMHQILNPNRDSAYWDFSASEIGEIDIPTIVDYVLYVSRYTKLIYIAHSQGTRVFYIMCSEYPEYNNKISLMVGMGVVGFISNMKSPIFRSFAAFADKEYFLYKHLGYPNEILPSNALIKALTGAICGVALTVTIAVCTNIVFMLFGYNFQLLNITNIPNIAQHSPAGASTKQLIHYFQEVNSGNFQKFNYGETKNIQVYGSKTPPHYHLERVTAPAFNFYSDNDWLVDASDAKKTTSRLRNVLGLYRVPHPKFGHLDYLWGLHSETLVYEKISEVLNKRGLHGIITTCSKK